MNFLTGYLLFFAITAAANGIDQLLDPTSLIGFLNILVLATIFLSPLLVDQKSLEEAAKRQEEIQRQGEQLKRRYYETRSCEDFKAWWDWCVKYNNGWWN